jgi:protein-S-isoprenylcysteine O-methyltransferase Ste14
MVEFITAAFAPVNVVFTVLLLLSGLYWITVIIGVLDINLFDIDLPDSGLEADVEVDADADIDVGGAGMFRSILHFFYVGEVPTMILVSILILSLWTFSMLGNYYFNPGGSMLVAAPIFLGNGIASAFVMKLCAVPLRRLYTMLNKDYNAPGEVLGRICKVTTTRVTKEKMGQAEVPTKGAPIILNVLSQDDHEFTRGEEAVVVAKDSEKGTYLIAPVNLEG